MPTDLIPADFSDAALWAIIVGFFSPIALNLIVSALWPSWLKSVAAFIFAAVVGTITAFIAGAYEGLGIPSTILLTLVVAITAYQNFWRQVAPNMQRDTKAKTAAVEGTWGPEPIEAGESVAVDDPAWTGGDA